MPPHASLVLVWFWYKNIFPGNSLYIPRCPCDLARLEVAEIQVKVGTIQKLCCARAQIKVPEPGPMTLRCHTKLNCSPNSNFTDDFILIKLLNTTTCDY